MKRVSAASFTAIRRMPYSPLIRLVTSRSWTRQSSLQGLIRRGYISLPYSALTEHTTNMLMNATSLPFPPDASLRRPLSTGLELLPFLACFYLHCLLVMLPNTRILRLSLLPASLHQAYYVITCLDYSKTAAPLLGPFGYRPDRLGYINMFVVVSLVVAELEVNGLITPKPDRPAFVCRSLC